MKSKGMKRWTDLGGDINWEDYGGKWGRKAPDGSWYVLDFTNMDEACGKDNEGNPPYLCDVKQFDAASTPDEEIARGLRSSGYVRKDGKLLCEHDGTEIPEEHAEAALVEMCVSHGLGAPLETFQGRRASWVRAEARRYAEQCMKDAALLERRLNRPVNAIGSTAREFGAGDIQSALVRGDSASHQLMRKLHGIPEEHRVQFGTLHEDGSLTDQRSIRQSDLARCQFRIMAPEHYRDDGSCKCDDAAHREFMIKEWEYEPGMFSCIPLRSEPHKVSEGGTAEDAAYWEERSKTKPIE